MKKLLITIIFPLFFYVQSFAQTQSYGNLSSNNNGTYNWVNIGTATMPQGGYDAYIRFISESGFNASINQIGYVELHIKTGNGASLDGSGFAFAATATASGRSNFMQFIHIVPNNSGVSATAYTVYAYCGPYAGSSFYSAEISGGCSWAASNTLAGTAPGGYNVPFEFQLNNTAHLMGNVGIGTTTPVTVLHAVVPSPKATATGNVVSLLSSNDASNPFGLRTMIYGAPAIGNRYVTLQTTDYSLVDGGNVVLQPSTGNVGVGTTTPDQKLTVNGTVHSKAVVVDNSIFPDYVFKKTYALRPLSAVKTYIELNHHLPEMPSAAEVAKSGQNLGEINALLLKKVEELTLYMIELNKTVKAQQQEIEALKKKN